MESTLTWTPPSPGPWQQDQAHNPVAQTPMMQAVYPVPFTQGMEAACAEYGLLLDRLAMGVVNGFTYHQPQPFDMPGPNGPPDHDWVVSEIGRRTGVAANAFEARIWRDALRRWDTTVKPAALKRHRELDRELTSLTDAQLQQHVHECLAHLGTMVWQHHSNNLHAMVPVGDFVLQAAGWTHRSPLEFFAVLDGYSPVSSVCPPDLRPAIDVLRGDAEARAILDSGDDAASVVERLCARIPELAEHLANMRYRILDGFDVVSPTIGERPEGIVGRVQMALKVDPDDARRRADALASQMRDIVPPEHRAAFDDLLAEARLVYRLRDERGLYSDISGIGLLRLAVLEFGHRLAARGRLIDATDVFEASEADLDAMFDGSDAPSAEDLHQRVADRLERTRVGAPRFLGPPPPSPPPVDTLPPPLARVMSAVGFMVEGILGELESPVGDAVSIGGLPGAGGAIEGTARLVFSIDDLFELEQGEVLVTPSTGEAFNAMLHLVSAIVTDHGSYASHAAIVSREMGIPAVVGTVNGTSRIANGARIRVDGDSGQVTILS